MAVVTPPLFQTLDSVYSGADLGLPYRDLISEGVAGASDLAVTERGAGANMSVDVAAGVAWVRGDDSALQPVYRCYNDGVVNLAIAAADGTNPRIDLVIAEVRDAGFSGVSTDWRLRVVTGTPAASPAAPATPNNAIVLARVSVPANDTAITNSQITDYRPRAGLFAALGVPTVTALPTQPYDGQVVDYLADATNGIVWRLKYRAASASAYKWEFVGGPPLRSAVSGSLGSTGSAAYVDLTTTGPNLTAPLAGDYDADLHWTGSHTIALAFGVAAVKVGGAATVDANGVFGQNGGANGNWTGTARIRLTGVLVGDLLKMQFRSGSGATMSVGNSANGPCTLHVTPVRVG